MSSNIITNDNLFIESELGQYLTDLVDAVISSIRKLQDHDLQVQIVCDLNNAVDKPNAVNALFAVQDVVNSYGLILFTS